MSKHHRNGKADHHDAELIVKLYEAQAAQQVPDAMAYLFSNDYPADFAAFREKHPAGSSASQERLIYKALGYYETIGTLYRNGLINEDLLFDWLAVDLLWDRLKSFVVGVRGEIGSDRMYENFEYMAEKNAKWSPSR
ncbi:MAG: DUF4760 domain-containing protein [Chloroflexota bacterium]